MTEGAAGVVVTVVVATVLVALILLQYLVLMQSAAALGIHPSPRASWAPWRSYAALHVWRARPAKA